MTALESDEHCEGNERIPGASPGGHTLGQVAITARVRAWYAGERRRPRMTRTGGVLKTLKKGNETRGDENRKDEPAESVGARQAGGTSERDGPRWRGGHRTVRRDRRTLKGTVETSREASIRLSGEHTSHAERARRDGPVDDAVTRGGPS